MIIGQKPRPHHLRGLTFLELTIVIAVMLAMTAMLFFGVRSWRAGTDRAACVLTQRNVQLAMRSYQNMYGFSEGGSPTAYGGSQNIVEQLYLREFINDEYYSYLRGERLCSGSGAYSVPSPTIFPVEGVLFMRCSLGSTRDHEPPDITGW